MRLLVDQGNSRLKIASLIHGRVSAIEPTNIQALSSYLIDNYVERVHICSVQDDKKLAKLLAQLEDFEIPFSVATTQGKQKGLINSYKVPEKMGIDRWLAMLAVWCEIKSDFVLVDAGSALTFDSVNSQGKHQGGHIIPGLGLMHKALHSNTDRVHFDTNQLAKAYTLGTDTTQAVLNGCVSSLVAYVEQQYRRLSSDNDLPMYLTGGDADILEAALSFPVHRREDLVIKGLIEYFDLV